MNLTPLLRTGALFATVTLASCGYTPLYAPGEGASAAAGRVQVGDVAVAQGERNPDSRMANKTKNVGMRRTAQTVAQELKLNFPNTGAAMDTLTVNMEEETNTLAVQRSAAISRAEIYLNGKMELVDADGKSLLKADLSASAPYNVEDTPFSTESGKTYARLTAARNLAAEISRRVYLYYSTRPDIGGAAK
jgi:hypothetical protein